MARGRTIFRGDTVEIRDLGLGRIIEELSVANTSVVKVGLPEDGFADFGSGKGSGHDELDMSELIQVGAVHEFGAPKAGIPERSWMRSAIDENREKINQIKEKLYGNIIDGRTNTQTALGKLGLAVETMIKRKITTLREPALDPKTIANKGSSNPLIDIGQMRASIQSIVELRSI